MASSAPSDDTAKAVAAAFVRFDGGGKGYLTRHELRCAHVALLGHAPSLVRVFAPRFLFMMKVTPGHMHTEI